MTGDTNRDGRRVLLGTLAVDVVLPLGGYYGLRLAGVSMWWALLIGGLRRPPLLSMTQKVMPAEQAARWEHEWQHSALFRRGIRIANGMWGVAFLLDAVARVVMALTLPVDLVPVLSTVLLVVLLIIAKQLSLDYGRRRLRG